MNSLLIAVGLGVVAPAAVALGLAWLLGRGWLAQAADRSTLAMAAAAAFLAGCAFLPGVTKLLPDRHYHWLPYVGLLAAVVGSLTPKAGALTAARWLLVALAALAAAWKLVPAWDDLWPPWIWSIALLAGYFLLLVALLETLPDRLVGPALPGILAVVAAVLAAVVLQAVNSARFAQLGGVLFASLAGCWVGGLKFAQWPQAGKGLIAVYAMLAGGLAYVGCIDRQPEKLALLGIPAAPLALWAFAAGPLSRLQGKSAIAAHVGAVLIPLAIASAIACIPAPEPAW